MKLGQQLRAIITKRGRTILNQAGSTWDVLEALENILSTLTDKTVEIIWDDDCTICIYRDNELIFWTGTTPEGWEATHLIDSLNKIDPEDSNFKATLLETEEQTE